MKKLYFISKRVKNNRAQNVNKEKKPDTSFLDFNLICPDLVFKH